MEAHQAEKKFNCDVCDKSFVLEWRYKKHVSMHTDMNVKSCHFFKNRIKCPYELIGCMFKHVGDIETLEDEVSEREQNDKIEQSDGEDSSVEESNPVLSNKCHLCNKQENSRDDLYNHMETEHIEYFNGIVEASARMSNLD